MICCNCGYADPNLPDNLAHGINILNGDGSPNGQIFATRTTIYFENPDSTGTSKMHFRASGALGNTGWKKVLEFEA